MVELSRYAQLLVLSPVSVVQHLIQFLVGEQGAVYMASFYSVL